MIKGILIGILIGVVVTIAAFTTAVVIKQPGCAYAGEPVTPTGWYRVHEWKGNPLWCHQ